MFAVHSKKTTIQSGSVVTPVRTANYLSVKAGHQTDRARASPRAEDEPEVAAVGWIRPFRDAARVVVTIVAPESGLR